uniref:Uncharacterized protein n=1 Tax=viral metagenome TaxID=1070528 RepID=A0A6M3JLY6_9ZZZZ
MTKDDYMEGICKVCFNIEEGKETRVRNKNLYITGSEGLDICWTCEKKILEFINKVRTENLIKRKENFKKIGLNLFFNNENKLCGEFNKEK